MTEETLKEIYGKNIKKFREGKHLTQEKFAESVGISEKYLSARETGRNFGSLETIVALSNALEVEPFELFLPQNKKLSYDSRRTKILVSRLKSGFCELVDTVEDFLSEE